MSIKLDYWFFKIRKWKLHIQEEDLWWLFCTWWSEENMI